MYAACRYLPEGAGAGEGGGTCCLDLNKGTPIRTKCYSSRGVLFEELCDLQYCTEYVYFLIRKEYLKPVTKKNA